MGDMVVLADGPADELLTSLCVLAGSTGSVSSTVASRVLSARPTSYKPTKVKTINRFENVSL